MLFCLQWVEDMIRYIYMRFEYFQMCYSRRFFIKSMKEFEYLFREWSILSGISGRIRSGTLCRQEVSTSLLLISKTFIFHILTADISPNACCRAVK